MVAVKQSTINRGLGVSPSGSAERVNDPTTRVDLARRRILLRARKFEFLVRGTSTTSIIVFYDSRLGASASCVVQLRGSFAFHGRRDVSCRLAQLDETPRGVRSPTRARRLSSFHLLSFSATRDRNPPRIRQLFAATVAFRDSWSFERAPVGQRAARKIEAAFVLRSRSFKRRGGFLFNKGRRIRDPAWRSFE